MATLVVQNIPDDLHQRIQVLAKNGCRSMEDEVVELLDRAVSHAERYRGRMEALDYFRRNQIKPPEGMPEAQDLIRQDRDR